MDTQESSNLEKMQSDNKLILSQLKDLQIKYDHLSSLLSNFVPKMGRSMLESIPANNYDQPCCGRCNSETEKRLQSLESQLQNLPANNMNADASISHQFVERMDVVGLREAVTTNSRALRWMWAFLFFAGFVLSIYFLYETAREYLKEPVVTKVMIVLYIRDTSVGALTLGQKGQDVSNNPGLSQDKPEKVERRPQTEYEYPTITLCTRAWYDFEKAKALEMPMDAFIYSLGYMKPDSLSNMRISHLTNARQEFLNMYQNKNFSSLVQYYEAISTDLQPAFSPEEFQDSTWPVYLVEPARKSPWKLFMPMFSMCYAFPLRPANARLGVMWDSERILLKFMDKTGGLAPSTTSVWYMFLDTHAGSFYTLPRIIPQGKRSRIMIKQEQYNIRDRNEHPCVKQEKDSKKNASITLCIVECSNEIRKKKFGCNAFWYSAGGLNQQHPSEFCNYFDRNIENSSAQRFFSLKQEEVLDIMKEQIENDCYLRCSHRCVKAIYDAVYKGSEPFIDEEYGSQETDTINGTNMTVTEIQFMHDSMRQNGVVTIEEESAYTFVQLVNNIGGTLGLFIGATLMTVPQLIMFIIGYFCDKMNNITAINGLGGNK